MSSLWFEMIQTIVSTEMIPAVRAKMFVLSLGHATALAD